MRDTRVRSIRVRRGKGFYSWRKRDIFTTHDTFIYGGRTTVARRRENMYGHNGRQSTYF